MSVQEVLPLYAPDNGLDTHYIVGQANAHAYAALIEAHNLPSYAVLLHGEKGTGKTTLAHLWAKQHQAIILTEETLDSLLPVIETGNYMLDDCEHYDETTLFHLLNQIKAAQATLLLTASCAVSDLTFNLPDLLSRLRALPKYQLNQPDDLLLQMVLHQQLTSRQLTLDAGQRRYIITHGERTYASINKYVARLDKASMTQKRRITLPLIKDILRS